MLLRERVAASRAPRPRSTQLFGYGLAIGGQVSDPAWPIYATLFFYAPRTSSITQTRGAGTPTIVRATTATETNNDGFLVTALSGEIRQQGARRIRNIINTTSEDFSNAAWVKQNAGSGVLPVVTSGFADPDGGLTAYRVQLDNGGVGSGYSQISNNGSTISTAGPRSLWIKSNTGASQILSLVYNTASAKITATTEWQRISVSPSAAFFVFDISTKADLGTTQVVDVLVWHAQLEDVTAQTTQTAGEYVSVGVLSAPYHGAGVDGVKYFSTDISGAPIPAATLDGSLVEAAATQYLGVTGTPATQTTASLGTGTYTLWCEGTGSCIASAGTATITGAAAASAGAPDQFEVTVAGTVTVTVTGSLTTFNLTNTPYQTSYIANTGAAGTSTTRNKDVLDDQVASNLTAAAGTVAFQWTPSHDPSGTVALCGSYVDASNYTALLHDATKYIWRKRIAGVNYDAEFTAAYANGTAAKISMTWGASGINLAVDGVLGTADTTGIEGVQYGKLPGTAGAYFSTPDSVANSITGDIHIVVELPFADYTPLAESVVVSKYGAAGNRGFLISLTTGGLLRGYWSVDGTAVSSTVATVALSDRWFSVERVAATGAFIFKSSADGVTFSQLGDALASTAGNLFDSTAALIFGAETGGTLPTSGNLYRGRLYNVIGGATPVVDFNPADYTHGTTWTSSATGEVYTINGDAAVWPAVKLGTRWQWGSDGNSGQQAGGAFKEKYLSPHAISDYELRTITI